MDDGADVGLIDAETEGDSADDYARVSGHPGFLILTARGRVHFAVIGDRVNAPGREGADGGFDAINGGGIDDDAAFGMRTNRVEELSGLRIGIAFSDDVIEIGAMKAGDKFAGIAELELFDDVVADMLCGAGGERGDGTIGEMSAEAAELAVFGTKFVAPFGDAVSFVNHEEGDGDVAEPVDGVRQSDALGGKVEQAVTALLGGAHDFAAFFFFGEAIEGRGFDAHLGELRGLILHEGDERGDYDGGFLRRESGGQLIAERFAAAGGHYDAGVFAGN